MSDPKTTIQDIQARKKQLEQSIATQLTDFIQQTGVRITDIDLFTTYAGTCVIRLETSL